MFGKLSKSRLFFLVALVIGSIGASGQSYLLYHELVHTYPYKIMDSAFYESIANVGVYFATIVAVIVGFLLGLRRFWLAIVAPVVFCPLLFAAIFKAFSLVRGQLDNLENATWNFDGKTPAMAAQEFFVYTMSLAIAGLIIGGICSFLLSWLSKERKLT